MSFPKLTLNGLISKLDVTAIRQKVDRFGEKRFDRYVSGRG